MRLSFIKLGLLLRGSKTFVEVVTAFSSSFFHESDALAQSMEGRPYPLKCRPSSEKKTSQLSQEERKHSHEPSVYELASDRRRRSRRRRSSGFQENLLSVISDQDITVSAEGFLSNLHETPHRSSIRSLIVLRANPRLTKANLHFPRYPCRKTRKICILNGER